MNESNLDSTSADGAPHNATLGPGMKLYKLFKYQLIVFSNVVDS